MGYSKKMANKCPRCQHPVPSGEKRCPSCGVDIYEYAPEKMRCPICKELYPKGAKFCLKDGSPLESAEIDFSREATIFLSSDALKKSTPFKKPGEPLSDKDRIPTLAQPPSTTSFKGLNSKKTPDKKLDKNETEANSFDFSIFNISPEETTPSQHTPGTPKPTIEDTFDLYQALINNKDKTAPSSTPPSVSPTSSSFEHNKRYGVSTPKFEEIKDKEKEDLKSILSQSLKGGTEFASPKQEQKPSMSPTPQPSKKEDLVSEKTDSKPYSLKFEMTPELLAAKEKLKQKYSQPGKLKKTFTPDRLKTLEEYDRLIAESDQKGNGSKIDDFELKPAPSKINPGFFERLKIALKLLFSKK